MMRQLIRFNIAVLSATTALIAYAQPSTEVRFSDLFAGAQLGDDVIVQIADDKILIIDDKASPYQLERRNLIVIAKRARLEGKPVIRSFAESNVANATEGTPPTPPPKAASTSSTGDKGTMGATGKPGMDAGTALLDISDLVVPDGTSISVEMRGQTGGKGQKGGQGGRGGSGASGRSANSDFPACSRPCPDRGVPGGPGGQRGAGGIGGTGGRGGTVLLSASLLELQKKGPAAVSVVVKGGAAGQPGDAGERGIGGQGGPRGSGGNCECKDVPGPGADGPLGSDVSDATPAGSAGPDGAVRGY